MNSLKIRKKRFRLPEEAGPDLRGAPLHQGALHPLDLRGVGEKLGLTSICSILSRPTRRVLPPLPARLNRGSVITRWEEVITTAACHSICRCAAHEGNRRGRIKRLQNQHP